MQEKQQYTARDRLAANLVLLIIIIMFIAGVIALYMSGIFKPVEGTVSLADTLPLNLATPPANVSQSGFLGWLLPSANAEAPIPAEEPAPEEQSQADVEALTQYYLQSDNPVEQLLLQIEGAESDINEGDQVQVKKNDLALNTNLPTNWFNVLLLATDARDIKQSFSRTDVMIIASINAETGEIKLSSLSRDIFVDIPDTSGSNRINAAFAFGKANLAMKTINKNFHMNIEHYVLVNFSVMSSIVDSLGGIDIYIAEDNGSKRQEYQELNELVAVAEDYEGFSKNSTRHTLTADDMGTFVHLDGLQAVSYARIRKTDDDLQRGSRQRILLQTLLEKIMSNASLSSLITLFNNVSRTTETNLVVTKIMEVASKLLLSENITMTEKAIPVPGSYRGVIEKDKKGKDIDVLRIDMQKNIRELHEFIYGEYIAPPET